jgi:hypothetical protein
MNTHEKEVGDCAPAEIAAGNRVVWTCRDPPAYAWAFIRGDFMTMPVPPVGPMRPRSNGLGVAGFIVSLVGIFTAGILCPIGLLLSLLALFRSPRGFAIAGVFVGLLGTLILAAWLAFFGILGFTCLNFSKPMLVTSGAIDNAHRKIDIYQATHNHQFPDAITANGLIAEFHDGWGRPLHYIPRGFGYAVRSDGADGVTGTEDDLEKSYP